MKVKKTIYISSNELSEKLLKKAELIPSQDGIPATFDSSLCGFRFDGKTLYYGKPVGKSLVEFARGFKGEPFEKRFSSRFDELGFTFDLAKNKIYKKETLEEMLLLLSVLGYTKAYFMMEDCVEIEDEPYYGYMRYRYQSKDLKELDAFAKSVGIELIPQIPSLTGFSKTVRKYHYWFRRFDADDILRAEDPLALELVEKLVAFCRESFSSNRIHISLDDTGGYLGRWWYHYYNGYKKEDEMVVDHTVKVVEAAKRLGFEKVECYSDLLFSTSFPPAEKNNYYDKDFTEEREYEPLWLDSFLLIGTRRKKYRAQTVSEYIKANFPKDITLVCQCVEDYEKNFKKHEGLGQKTTFSQSVKCSNFTPHNRYYVKKAWDAIAACEKCGVRDYTLSFFNDRGGECSLFAHLPLISYVAMRAYNEEIDLLLDSIGVSEEDFLLLDLPDLLPSAPEDRLVAPSEYGLYNDPFLGIFDKHVSEADEARYSTVANILSRHAKEVGKYGYIFKTRALLSEILSKKYALGVKTRRAYRSSDRKAIKTLLSDCYAPLLPLIEKFKAAVTKEWRAENLTYGEEAHALHLGGLYARIKSQKERLEKWLDTGERIPELEEEILNATCGDYADGELLWESEWSRISSVNRI